uniref:Conserved plasma membrane protein n=1 Tax=Strongyloides stercoralis TaxID=6248 RepID=A0A0K0EM33_STRER
MVFIKSPINLTLSINNDLIKSTTLSTLEKINVTDTNEFIDFCKKQFKLNRMACCNIVKLLNDTNKLTFCDFLISKQQRRTINNTYNTPVYLEYPNDVHEDHVTFIFGIALLISIAALCTLILSKLTRPNIFGRVPITYMTNNNTSQTNDCNYFMWFPNCNYRGSSMLFYLRNVTCGNGRSGVSTRTTNSTSLSIVSQSSINFLPSYQSIASSYTVSTPLRTSTIISPISLPPPAYDENTNDSRRPINISTNNKTSTNSNTIPLLEDRE